MKRPTPEIESSLDVLFVSEKQLWPLDQGFRIRGSNLSNALVNMGLKVGTASLDCTDLTEVPKHMQARQLAWPVANEQTQTAFTQAWSGKGQWLRHKLASHQGVDLEKMAGLRNLVERYQPGVVVALGQHGPMLLGGIGDLPGRHIWYAADEPVHFQLSCMIKEPLRRWPERIRQALFYGALETVFVRGKIDAIGVSPLETRLLKIIGGAKNTTLIRNGVDLKYFCPPEVPLYDQPHHHEPTLVFWGRLDFEPNIDAVQWFAREVWSKILLHRPDARWQIVGKFPHESLRKVAKMRGVSLAENVPDLRSFACGASLTILPMRCGGGIKNKLLEAAAMALPVVVSPRAIDGLNLPESDSPFHVCHNARAWAQDILRLWESASQRKTLGERAHQWVTASHSWVAAAEHFCQFAELEDRLGESEKTLSIPASKDAYREAA